MSDRVLSLVIFDIDGTLLDTIEDHIGAYLEALDLFGFSNIDSRWGLYPEHTDSAILHELFQRHRGRRATSDEIKAFDRRLAQAFDARTGAVPLRLISGAEALLVAIQAAPSVVCALATGGLREVSIPKVARLAPYIEPAVVVTASDSEFRADILARGSSLRRSARTGFRAHHLRRRWTLGCDRRPPTRDLVHGSGAKHRSVPRGVRRRGLRRSSGLLTSFEGLGLLDRQQRRSEA
jgi:hypothetical protein